MTTNGMVLGMEWSRCLLWKFYGYIYIYIYDRNFDIEEDYDTVFNK